MGKVWLGAATLAHTEGAVPLVVEPDHLEKKVTTRDLLSHGRDGLVYT